MAPRAEVAAEPRAESTETDRDDVELTPAELREYEGTYYSPELETTYRLRVAGDRLIMVHQRHSDAELIPRGKDRFEGRALQMRTIEFSRGEDGDVDGFRVSGGRVLNLRFERVGMAITQPGGS